MPRYIGRHPTEPERDSVDNLKDVDITTTIHHPRFFSNNI